MLALLFLAVSPAVVESAPADISIRPSEPPAFEERRSIHRWRVLYTAEMAPVYRSWSAIVKVIHDRRLDELPGACNGLQQGLVGLDRRGILAVPDPVLRTWLGQGLALLDSAVGHCRHGRLFALDFRLHKARRLLLAVDRRLESYR